MDIEKYRTRLEWVRSVNEIPATEPEIRIGKNTEIHPTALIGEESYSLAIDEQGDWVRGLQHGGIIVEDGVHIAENVIIKRASLPNQFTRIGRDSKICASVHIAHNCDIGEHVFISAGTVLNGSVKIGNNAWIGSKAVIREHRTIGDGATVGMGAVVVKDVPPNSTVVGNPAKPIEYLGSWVSPDFIHGKNFKMGKGCVIESDVIVGDDVTLGHHVILKSGTRFGNNVKFADDCKTTGLTYLGNNVNVRTDSTISKGVIVEDCAFIGPGIMTNHTKNVVHMRPHLSHNQLVTRIGYGAVVGSTASLVAGVHIGDNVIIGAGGLVVKDILEPGVYVGAPVQKIKDLPNGFVLTRPTEYEEHRFSPELIEKYLPFAR